MIKVLPSAQVREPANTGALKVAVELATVEALRKHLVVQDDRWVPVLEDGRLLAAVNQTLVSFDYLLDAGDEVAFSPSVTGG